MTAPPNKLRWVSMTEMLLTFALIGGGSTTPKWVGQYGRILQEKHGDAAYRWAFNDFNDEFYVYENGKRIKVKSFEDGKQALFPEGIGKRTTYRSNFSDQHVIPQTLNIKSVSTRICFDSAFITTLYALIKRTFMRNLFKLKLFQTMVHKELSGNFAEI